MDISQIITNNKYKFLHEYPLKDNICLLTLGGSYAYGTNTPNSDIDIRGIAVNSKRNILTRNDFDNIVDVETDTVIYSLDKILNLLASCNPNTIEMLGCPKHAYILNDVGQLLLDNRGIFLSKRAVYSFGGYANAQLRRLQNALSRQQSPEIKAQQAVSTLKIMIPELMHRYNLKEFTIDFDIDSTKETLSDMICCNINITDQNFININRAMSELSNTIKQFDKINHRNKKKDIPHLAKHMMHLCRLYLMCFDILNQHEIITYRERDHDLLMSIRNGEFIHNGKIDDLFFLMVEDYNKRLSRYADSTTLTEEPDMQKITRLHSDINEIVVSNQFKGVNI